MLLLKVSSEKQNLVLGGWTNEKLVTIRLTALLPTRVAVVQFPDIEQAVRASTEALNVGLNLRELFILPLSHSLTYRKNVSSSSTIS